MSQTWIPLGAYFTRLTHQLNSFCAAEILPLSHSLTHCCAWPAEGRSVLHIERSWPAIQAAPTYRPMSSSTCCSQFLCGRPGGCFQSAVGGVPVWASIDSCSACKAGVFSGRRQIWPNNEWCMSAIRDGTSGSFVLSLTTALDTLSYHLIPRSLAICFHLSSLYSSTSRWPQAVFHGNTDTPSSFHYLRRTWTLANQRTSDRFQIYATCRSCSRQLCSNSSSSS